MERVTFGGCEDNLEVFIRRMVNLGNKIIDFFPMWDYNLDIMQYKNIEENDFNTIAYQALNFEHTNIRFFNERTNVTQTVSVMMTGDKWCDVVPINDWGWQTGKPDVVKQVLDKLINELRDE
tara:strand:- start:16971 stop:17336 length:366 start_codon:yes stop_codon:yes gene_type:complete